MIAALVLLALASPARLVRLPSGPELLAAVRSGDEAQLESAAARLGVRKLLRLASGGPADLRAAALTALPRLDDAWAVLPEVVHLLRDPDPQVAKAAALSARRVALALTPRKKVESEVPSDIPARAALALAIDASLPSLTMALRIAALQALAALAPVTRIEATTVAGLFKERDPKLRRAVAEALADLPQGEEALIHALLHDPVDDVAAAAAASICRQVPEKAPTSRDEARADGRALQLSQAARQRLRSLALDDKVALTDRLDLVKCLRVATRAADREVLDRLAHHGPEPLRRRARALGGH